MSQASLGVTGINCAKVQGPCTHSHHIFVIREHASYMPETPLNKKWPYTVCNLVDELNNWSKFKLDQITKTTTFKFDAVVTMKYGQGHWKWYERVLSLSMESVAMNKDHHCEVCHFTTFMKLKKTLKLWSHAADYSDSHIFTLSLSSFRKIIILKWIFGLLFLLSFLCTLISSCLRKL